MSGETSSSRPRAAAKKRTSSAKDAAPTERASQLAGSVLHSGEAIFHEASQMLATVRQGQQELGERLSSGSQARPYVAVGTALGVGFVLGGGLTLGLTRKIVAVGSRLVVSMVVRKVVENAGNLQA